MSRSEKPAPLFLRLLALLDIPFTLGILALGIYFLVTGNTGGIVVGVVIVVVAVARVSTYIRVIAGR